jgi:hypothetical protein
MCDSICHADTSCFSIMVPRLVSLITALVFQSIRPSIAKSDAISMLECKGMNIRGHRFSWKAEIDGETGRAWSREVSPNVAVQRRPQSYRYQAGTDFFRHLCWRQQVGEIFCEFPKWICNGTVTFGVLRSSRHTPLAENKYNRAQTTISLSDRFLGIEWLTFGIPSLSRMSFSTQVSKNEVCRTTLSTVSIPILGGLLVNTFSRQSQQNNKRTEEFQCLLFSLEERCRLQREDENWKPTFVHPYNNVENSVSIQTEIKNYYPSLPGYPPLPRWRRWSYLYTQSVVHAYAMWRLHLRCRSIVSILENCR